MRQKLWMWSKTPIHVPRILLTSKYVGFMVLGVLSALSGGVATLNLTTFEGYTFWWSYAVIAAGLMAAIGSIRPGWESFLEKWACLILFGLLSSWAVAAVIRAVTENDISRATGAFAIIMLSMLPGVRALNLLWPKETKE